MLAGLSFAIALHVDPGAGTADRPCEEFQRGSHYIELSPLPARAGARLSVKARQVDGPFGTYDIPSACLTGWRVEGAPGLVVDADAAVLQLPTDLPSGTHLVIRAKLGTREIDGEARTIGAHEPSVVGRWTQVNGGACRPAEGKAQIGELLFRDDGRFFVTYEPFESYYDYGGDYVFHPEGQVDLTVTSGDARPAWLRLRVGAKTSGERLALKPGLPRAGLFGPDDPGKRPQSCTMVFARTPAS